eukprot:75817-Ditylum_brightwellii.AAC.2
MTSTASAYEAAVLAKMLFKTLSKVGEDPNYVELSKLQQERIILRETVESRMLHPPIIQGTTIPLSVLALAEYYRVDKKLPMLSA